MTYMSRGVAPLVLKVDTYGDEWSDARPGRLTPVTHTVGWWWWCPNSLSGLLEKRKLFALCR